MLLKKLHQLRKVFLTKSWRRYYSQFGEDTILRELLARTRNGFFVDVGCFHPKKFSNTYWLYSRGWRGINIDMEPQKIALFNLARPDDVNLTAAISDQASRMAIQSQRSYDLGAKLVKDATTEKNVQITTKTLTEVIDSTRYKDHPIDLLTVDAEGMDLQVVRSLDMARYRPKLIIVEQVGASIEEILSGELHRLLSGQGYQLKSWVIHSLIYVKETHNEAS